MLSAIVATMWSLALSDVRQIVVFDFLPGRTEEAARIFEEEAVPLYRSNAPMLRFRGYREVESPVPIDLMVVSRFDGMAGMDASNRELREEAELRGTSIGAIYGRIGALSQSHRDAFAEIDPDLTWGATESGLVVFESHRLAPGAYEEYEQLLRAAVVPWEKASSITSGVESGRYLVSDGFDVIRIYFLDSLGDWHRHVSEQRKQTWSRELDRLVTASRQIILAPVPELSVR